ncbi:MAG: HAD family hydrolase [Chloroflexi bacterium]|nr:HAD family hydrolase [Chloroflexota bacterium]
MIKAVIFDIDGTLYDWEASIDRALRDVLPEVPTAYRNGLTNRMRQALADYALVVRDGLVVDRKYWLLMVDPVPPWRAALPDADSELAQRVAQRYQSLLDAVPFADASPALEALRAEYALGVLSNSPRSEETLTRLKFRHYFDAVVAASEPWRKPHPEAFRRACRALGVAPSEAVYVGDSIANDVEGALGAGLIPVWVDRYGDDYDLPEGAWRITSLEGLPDLLAELTG